MTMRNDAVLAFDEKYFQPLMTHSSPSLTARVVNMRRVGAGVRLGHRVAGEDLAVEQRAQVALLLLGRAVVGDDLGVAGVGRLAAEHDRRPLRPAEDLVEQRQLELAVALAAQLGAEVGGPQLLAPDLFLERVDDLAQLSSSGVKTRSGHTRSSGSTSSRTNASAQSSLAWNSGSVSKSHAMMPPLVDAARI